MNKYQNLTKQKSLALASVLFLGLNLSACGGGDSNETGGEDEDLIAPTVSSTSPVDNANDVPQNSTITATFNEDILNTSVDATSFTLAKSSGENTVGSVSFDGANNIASFTPNDALTKSTAYTATLSTNIADLSGNALASNYNWSFTTAGGGWSNAEGIESDTINAFKPQIAFDINGNALAVWYLFDGTNYSVWANRFDGTSWGSAEPIGLNDGGNAFDPQIAFGTNNNAIAVWPQRSSVNNVSGIWANHFNGTSWGNPELIDMNTGINPQISVDSNGYALVVWTQPGFNFQTWVSQFNGISWSNAERLDSNTGDAFNPQVTFGNNGNAMAVWSQVEGSFANIMVKRFNGIVWGNAGTIENNDTGGATQPQISIDDNNNAIVVWAQDISGSLQTIWANRFNGTNWGNAEPLESETINIDYPLEPQIAIDTNGNALAIWSKENGTRKIILANHFNGTSWVGAEAIDSDTFGDARDPQIAFDNNGNALAVWYQTGNNHIWVNRFNGTSWEGGQTIETENSIAPLDPQIAFDNNGNALSVWSQFDGTRRSIWSNRFE